MGRRSFVVRDLVEILEHWQQGQPVKVLARSLGVDPKTVRKYVAIAKSAGFFPGQGGAPPQGWTSWVEELFPGTTVYGRTQATVKELHKYKEEITALVPEITPTAAWRRLHREKGLKASLSSFRRYLRAYLPELLERKPITVRREDPPPGEEAQIDYGFLGFWQDPWTGKRRAVHVFAIVLSHSRHLFAQAVFHMDQEAWIENHVAAFTFFGGVPRRVVPDNTKTGVLKPDLYDPRFNRGYEELAHHYSFLIDPARAAKPKDKPRVERVIPFIRDDFWRGRAFSSLPEINTKLRTWCLEMAGLRVHGTTRQRPLEVFRLIEEPALLPLPADPFQRTTWAQAKVARDCHIQVCGAWYSIPHQYVGKTLSVRLTQRLVQCYLGYQLIKTHARVPKGRRSTDWNDYPPHKATFFMRTPNWCREQAKAMGPAVAQAVEGLLEDHALHHLRQAQGIIRLAEKYGSGRLDAACARANAFGDPSYRTIKNILERGLEREEEPFSVQTRLAAAFLRGPQELLCSGHQGEGEPV